MELLGLLKNKSYFSIGVGSRCTMNSDTFCHMGPGNSHFDLSDAAVYIIFSAAGIESDKCLCHNCNQLTSAKFAYPP